MNFAREATRRTSSRAARPSMPGSFTSMKTSSGCSVRATSIPFSPLAADRNWCPIPSTSRRKTQTMESSSSTTSTLATGQLDPEGGPAGARVVPDRAPVILDDLLGEGQAEAHPVLSRGDTGLEDLRSDLRRHAGARIGHGKPDLSVPESHRHAERTAGGHGLGAVEDQVHHAAFESGHVHRHLRDGGEGPLHPDAQVLEAAAHEF